MIQIEKVGVIGAGSMGSAIAALAASYGLEVVLLDIKGEANDPSRVARLGIEQALTRGDFFVPEAINNIRVGNLDEHFDLLSTCDWIIEAVVEDATIKRELFLNLKAVLKPGAYISTNTSTFTLKQLLPSGLDEWTPRFYATHFFNPPRRHILCELTNLVGERDKFLDAFSTFLSRDLGRRVLVVKDTPGFVANRLGIYSWVRAIRLGDELGLTPEEVDALTGPAIGRPRSATFKTIDFTGLDILVLGVKNLREATGDDFVLPSWIEHLFRQGKLGRKSGAGIFRFEKGVAFTFDPHAREYRPFLEPEIPGLKEALSRPFPERIWFLLELPNVYGYFLRRLLADTFAYVLTVTPEISPDIVTVDKALEWGFGWSMGPYAQMDYLGLAKVKTLLEESGHGSAIEVLERAIRHGRFFGENKFLDLKAGGFIPSHVSPNAATVRYVELRRALDEAGVVKGPEEVWLIRVGSVERAVEQIRKIEQEQQPAALVLVLSIDPKYPYGQLLDAAEKGDEDEIQRILGVTGDLLLTLARLRMPMIAVLDTDLSGLNTTVGLIADVVMAPVQIFVSPEEPKDRIPPFGAAALIDSLNPSLGGIFSEAGLVQILKKSCLVYSNTDKALEDAVWLGTKLRISGIKRRIINRLWGFSDKLKEEVSSLQTKIKNNAFIDAIRAATREVHRRAQEKEVGKNVYDSKRADR